MCGRCCVRKDQSTEGPVRGPGASPAAQRKPLCGRRPFSSQKRLPSTHGFGVLPTPPQIMGAGKADFQPLARPRLSRPSPHPGPSSGQSTDGVPPDSPALAMLLPFLCQGCCGVCWLKFGASLHIVSQGSIHAPH